MTDNIKFIEYTGKYPTLCTGTLVILFKGEEYRIRGWASGGGISFWGIIGIIAAGAFIAGFIDGIARPVKCD